MIDRVHRVGRCSCLQARDNDLLDRAAIKVRLTNRPAGGSKSSLSSDLNESLALRSIIGLATLFIALNNTSCRFTIVSLLAQAAIAADKGVSLS